MTSEPSQPGGRNTVVEADLTWVRGRFEQNVQVMITDAGLIEQVGCLDLQPTMRLRNKAIMPGMVNAHSHAFQRGLRGFGETFPNGASDFWTWRESMYELVELLDREQFKHLCRAAFEEMLRQGITTVGEFHYFHHEQGSQEFGFDDAVLEAAEAAGIRIVLLCTYYAHGGIGKSLEAAQERFATRNLNDFCAHVSRL